MGRADCAVVAMLIVAFALSILIGISLGLLGGGGSILTLPILVYVLHVDPHAAVATSLIVVGVTAAAGSIGHARAGRVRWKTAFVFGAASMVGAFATGKFAHLVPASVLLGGFAVMMVATAIAMLRGRKNQSAAAHAERDLPIVKVILEGVVVGGVTGLVGAGGGFLVVPALVLLGGLPMEVAVGTSLVVIALKSFAALAGHLSHAQVDLRLAAVVTVAAVIGSFIGGGLASRIPPDRLRRTFAWFVLAMGAFMLVQQLGPALHLPWAKGQLTAIAAATGAFTALLGALVERARRGPPRSPRATLDNEDIEHTLTPQDHHA